MIRLIAWKELRGLLHAPSTWIILGVLQFILAWSYLMRMEAFIQLQDKLTLLANAPGATSAVVPGFFNAELTGLLLVLTPAFTMRLFAEERRNQTLALLLSAPVSARDIVLGKFFGLTAFLWLIVLWCSAMLFTLRMGTHMDSGLLLANCIGMLLLSASFAALGLYISSLTAQPIVAAIGALVALAGLWLVEAGASDANRLLHTLPPTAHFHSFNSGLLDSADFVYFLAFCTFFLLLTIRRLRHARLHD